ncbi:RNA polymerase sigma factor [Rhodobacter sp. SY28-1]|uniref:RNA polymerase sigma factor n=1 Tax=Rhodobacter sp. SY28-1 TaxID=2562317 RepID=UPI0010C06DC3|nr:sigma-70 family RNA polymerase sigma factor [Rhodobacter sp. SY28-1]
MAALAAGDRQAMAVLIRRHGPGLRRFLAGVLDNPHEAEDMAQETFLRVWAAAARYDPTLASPATWVYRIALRLAIDRNRRTGFRRFLGLDAAPEPVDDQPGADRDIAARQALARTHLALATLPDRQRRALLLRATAGLSNSEIAATLGISSGAVEQLLVRARSALRTIMMGEME